MTTGLFLILVVAWAILAIGYEVYVWRIHRMDLTISRLSRRYIVFRIAMLAALGGFALWFALHSDPHCHVRLQLWVHCA